MFGCIEIKYIILNIFQIYEVFLICKAVFFVLLLFIEHKVLSCPTGAVTAASSPT